MCPGAFARTANQTAQFWRLRHAGSLSERERIERELDRMGVLRSPAQFAKRIDSLIDNVGVGIVSQWLDLIH
jgi:hypothetical protein